MNIASSCPRLCAYLGLGMLLLTSLVPLRVDAHEEQRFADTIITLNPKDKNCCKYEIDIFDSDGLTIVQFNARTNLTEPNRTLLTARRATYRLDKIDKKKAASIEVIVQDQMGNQTTRKFTIAACGDVRIINNNDRKAAAVEITPTNPDGIQRLRFITLLNTEAFVTPVESTTPLGPFLQGDDLDFAEPYPQDVLVEAFKNDLTEPAAVVFDVISPEGVACTCDPVIITVSPDVPSAFTLDQNYPNPFNPTTTIPFGLVRETHVELAVFDVLGKRIALLVDDTFPAGTYTVEWDGRDDTGARVAGGAYIYRVKTERTVVSKTMTLLK